MSNGVLVVKCKAPIPHEDYKRLLETLQAQHAIGTVVIPAYCDAIYIPGDTEVKLEELND